MLKVPLLFNPAAKPLDSVSPLPLFITIQPKVVFESPLKSRDRKREKKKRKRGGNGRNS
jgi:hypothetical protein